MPQRSVMLCAMLAGLAAASSAPGQPAPPPVVVESAATALARLDSLMTMVRDEEARVGEKPGVEGSWDRLARAWFQVGDHARASASLARARALGAREPETALLLGRVARSEGRFAEAIEWLERAARRSRDWEVQEDLGLALYLAGRLPEAADAWARARELPGSQAPARHGLLEAMRRAGPRAYRVRGRGRERLPFGAGAPRGAMVVEVAVNGRGPFAFRVDIGSPEIVLGRSLATELGLETFAGGETGVFVGDQPVRLDYAAVDSLTLGDTSLGPLPVAVSDHTALSRENGVRGTLGLEALRRFRFCLDRPDSALWLEPASPASAPADTVRPAWLPSGSAVRRVPVLLRGTHLLVAYGAAGRGPERPFLVDMGGPGVGLAAPMSTLAEAGIAVDTSQVQVGSSGAGPVGYYRFEVPRLCVAGVCRDSLLGIYGIFPPRLELNPNFRIAGLVLSEFWSRYRVGIDLTRCEMWLVEP